MSKLELKISPAPGDLLLSRHLDEEKNTSPGYWNHTAIMGITKEVIHAIRDKGVIVTPYDEYFNSCGKIKIIRLQIGPNHRLKIAQEAYKHVGVKYKTLESLFFRLFRRSFNCTGLARKCYKNVMGKDPKWRIPDNVLESKDYIHHNLK